MSESLLPTAMEALDLASDLVRNRLPGQLTAKGERDYASEVDYAVEQDVRGLLKKRTPSIGFLGEEEGVVEGSSELLWTLDPIDGTVNFAQAVPLCAVSLALLREGHPILGVVDLPFLSSRYTAVEGRGAYRNGQRLQVSDARTLAEAIVSIGDYAVGDHANEKNRTRLALTAQLAGRALRVRMLGSAAIDLVWVAEGKLDASIALSNKPWDTAAGVIIAREAGARVVDHDGKEHAFGSASTIAANPHLMTKVLMTINEAAHRPR